MCGEAFGDLAAEGLGGGARRSVAIRGVGSSGRGGRIAGHFGKGRVERGGIKQSGAHFAQTHFRAIVISSNRWVQLPWLVCCG